MSTFIHNEPTCLTILQEAKLPQTLLEAISKDIPISAEVNALKLGMFPDRQVLNCLLFRLFLLYLMRLEQFA